MEPQGVRDVEGRDDFRLCSPPGFRTGLSISASIVGSRLSAPRGRVPRRRSGRSRSGSRRVDQGVDLGAQSAARAADRLVLAGFFGRRRYAMGDARRCCRSSRILSASAARYRNTRSRDTAFWPNDSNLRWTSVRRRTAPADRATASGTVTIQHRLYEQPIVRRGHPDRAFASRQQVLDPLPLIVTQSEPPHRSAPYKLIAYESKKPPRRNRPRIIRR